ncbi:MAG: hypothetical protein JXB14_00350 [Candidatus Altiarchaeota archaeon]|nr:hypothetical protein [Candidatus Altiarchaeota archaeon]
MVRRNILLVTLVSLLALLFFGGSANAFPWTNDSQNSTIIVRIQQQTYVNLDPAVLNWVGVNPGSEGNSTHENNGYTAIQIENIGSRNITYIWLNTTYPRIRPEARGTADFYDTGNFVAIARENDRYYFPNRVDYNETRSLVYLKDPAGSRPPNAGNYHYGRFRNGSSEWFWFVDKTGSGPGDDCSETGTNFYIGDVAHTRTSTGSADFSSCDAGLTNAPAANCRSGTLTNDPDYPDWAYADVNVGGALYTVAVNSACNMTMWNHWNKDGPGGHFGSYSEMFWNGTTNGNFTPGNSTVANIKVFIPYGTYEGNIASGQLMVIVSDQ